VTTPHRTNPAGNKPASPKAPITVGRTPAPIMKAGGTTRDTPRFRARGSTISDMMVQIGGKNAVSAYGKWRFKEVSKGKGGGLWKWVMILRGGKSYLIKLMVNSGFVPDKEMRSMELLEGIAATFKLNSE